MWRETDRSFSQTPVTLNQDTPMEVVVQMFQRLGLRFVLLTRHGVLKGVLTKMVRFLPSPLPFPVFQPPTFTTIRPDFLSQDLHSHIHGTAAETVFVRRGERPPPSAGFRPGRRSEGGGAREEMELMDDMSVASSLAR